MRALFLTLTIAAAPILAAQYQETIIVSRVIAEVRVTKANGEPITGLTRADFDVKIGGLPAEVLSVRWDAQEGHVAAADVESDEPARPGPIERPVARRQGNLYVVFIQTDFARNRPRTTGQMKFRRYAEEIIDSLGEEDRIAVFSFDSHLKFRLDFTSDREAVKQAIRNSIRIDFPPPPPTVPEPSLAPLLDRREMKLSVSSEEALILIAEALREIDGPKTLMLMGWGLGERAGSVVQPRREWPKARAALLDSRTTIFALDTTEADHHDLSVGLASAAEATGGFYASTFRFPQASIDRLKRTLSGSYELELRVPESLRHGRHTLDVHVRQRGAEVLAPAFVTGGG